MTQQPNPQQTVYKAVVHAEEKGRYRAEVPDLPGCLTQGDTLDEVYHNLTEAIACHLDLATEDVRIGLLEAHLSSSQPQKDA